MPFSLPGVGSGALRHACGGQSLLDCVLVFATYLNQIFALRFRNQRLKLWCCEGVYEPSFRDHKQQDLRACQHRQLIRL